MTAVDDGVDLGAECRRDLGRGGRGRLAVAVGAGRGKRAGAPEQLERDRMVGDANAERRSRSRGIAQRRLRSAQMIESAPGQYAAGEAFELRG